MLIPGAGPISYNAYRWNSPVKMTLPGGSTTDYTYDPLMRVKAILAKDPGQNQIVTREYQYSGAGNITSKNTEHGSYTYEYDALYRLTQADNPTLPDEAYTYDAIGNRLTAASISGEWAYNPNNELLGYGSKTFTYDLNGNMTRKADAGQETSYIYDVEDRLVGVENNSSAVVAEYYYDPFGRRLWKDVDGIRTYFVYSDEGLVGEYDASGTELRTYGWAPQSQWGTDPFFVKIGSQYYWYQNDHQGTPQKLITSSGQVVWAATYDSFGNAQIGVEVITNNLRFPGQYYDAETGLHYNLNRYYDPTTGRYLRIDPYGEGLNLYAYCFSNPLSLIDPMGLCAIKTAWQFSCVIRDVLTGRWMLGHLIGWIDNGTYNNWFTQGLAAGAYTVLTVAQGLLYSPEHIVGQFTAFYENPHYTTIPFLGPLGKAIGEGWAEATLNPSFTSISQAIGYTLFGFDTALGGVALFRGITPQAPKTTTEISPFRYTTRGESFEHYSYGKHAESLSGGLHPGSYGTTAKGLSGAEAKSGLSLRHAKPPDAVYTVTPPPGTLIRVNPVTRPQFGQPGGLPEVEFILGTPPGSVSGPTSIIP